MENISFFDSYWVAVHFGAGLMTGIALILFFHHKNIQVTPKRYARYGISLLVLWEYFELFLRYADKYEWTAKNFFASFLPESFFAIESITNIISDLVVGSFGLFLVYQYYRLSSRT